MTVENIQISTKEYCRPGNSGCVYVTGGGGGVGEGGMCLQPPDHQSDMYPTELPGPPPG